MSKYCVIFIVSIMLMPLSEVRASEATIVASLSITERQGIEAHETLVVLPEQTYETRLRVGWDTPMITVIARPAEGNSIEQIAIAGQPIDFSNVKLLQEVSVY